MLNAPLNRLNVIAKASQSAPRFVEAGFTRPNDTTQYAAKDVIFSAPPGVGQPTALVFPNVVSTPGGAGIILAAAMIDLAAQATKLNADLLLFTEQPSVAPVDNTAFAPTSTYFKKRRPTIAFPNSVAVEVGGFSEYEVAVNKAFTCAPTSTNLYFFLIARNTYTPIANEEFVIQLSIVERGIAVY